MTENITVSAPAPEESDGTGTVRRGLRSERARDAEFVTGAFDAILQTITGSGWADDDAVRLTAEANRQSQSNSRITQDDLRMIEDHLDRHEAYLKSRYHALQRGATAVARGRLGLGDLAGPFGPSLAESTRAMKSSPTAQAGAAELVAGQLTESVRVSASRPQENAPQNSPEKPPVQEGGPPAERPQPRTPVVDAKFVPHVPAEGGGDKNRPVPAFVQDRTASSSVRTPAPSNGAKTAPSKIASTPRNPSADSVNDNLRAGKRALEKNKAQKQPEISPAPSRHRQDKMIKDVLRVVRANLSRRHALIKMRLSPPELGRLTVEMQLKGNALKLDIAAQDTQIRNLLEDSSQILRDALQELGIRIERFQVSEEQVPPFADDARQESGDAGFQHSDNNSDERSQQPPTTPPSAISESPALEQDNLSGEITNPDHVDIRV